MCECAKSCEGYNVSDPSASQGYFVSVTTDTASWNWLNVVGIKNTNCILPGNSDSILFILECRHF